MIEVSDGRSVGQKTGSDFGTEIGQVSTYPVLLPLVSSVAVSVTHDFPLGWLLLHTFPKDTGTKNGRRFLHTSTTLLITTIMIYSVR